MSTAPSITEDLRAGLTRTIANAVAREAQRHSYDVFSEEVLTALAKGIDPFVCEVVAEALAPLAKRIVELEAKVIDLTGELAKKVEYHRVWKAEVAYKPNNEVTFKGQLWFCEKPNSGAKPGTGNEWSLMHKRERL